MGKGYDMMWKKWLTLAVAIGFVTQAALGAGLGVFGSYWDPKDADSEIGFGARLSIPLGPDVSLDLRGRYFEFEESSNGGKATLEVIPIEAALIFQLAYQGPVYPYVGGGGGYYLFDLEWEGPEGRVNPNVDDEFGWFVLGGLQLPLADNISLFGEAKYMWLKIERIAGFETTGDNRLDGFGANVGLLLEW